VKTSDEGRALILEREGCRLRPYQDSVGVWTDGVGNTIGVVPNGPPITRQKADADLECNLGTVERTIEEAVQVDLRQYQFDALASFIFNIGETAFRSSTLVRRLNTGDFDGAAAEFNRWHIPAGITSRRNGEREQFKGTAQQARIS
jgi:lysozyme